MIGEKDGDNLDSGNGWRRRNRATLKSHQISRESLTGIRHFVINVIRVTGQGGKCISLTLTTAGSTADRVDRVCCTKSLEDRP
jgi:hypothetical protein